MKQNNLIFILASIIIAGGSFFAGIKYQENKSPNFQMMGQNGRQFQGRGGMMGGNRTGSGPIIGEILNSDDKSITVKLQDGSTKIVILSDKTTINKASTGTKSDLKTGERVAAFGQENSDGSITAQNIQLNPELRGRVSTPSAK